MKSQYKVTVLFVHFLVRSEGRRRFIRKLDRLGFCKFDTNTYFRPTAPEKVNSFQALIAQATPRAATVKVMRVTDKQWTDTVVYIGKDN